MTLTKNAMRQRKALALISGGLDSLLAARIIMAQGIHVEGINFFTGFCGKRIRCSGNDCDEVAVPGSAAYAAQQLGIKLHRLNVFNAYKKVVLEPQHGYGAHLNPCLDCRIFMVGQTYNYLREHGFDFIISGEVIGQRPKSQLKHLLPLVQKESGAHDLLLRPLSAKLLAPTLPEREGWVKRDLLYGFNGRNRKPQMALTQEFGITEYAQPSGGCCFLINQHYCARLEDLWQARGHKDYSLPDLVLLKVGRHIRPKPHFKLIIGRDAFENELLRSYMTSEFASLESAVLSGPLVLIDGNFNNDEDLQLAAQIVARYTSHKGATSVPIVYKKKNRELILQVTPLPQNAIVPGWIVGGN